MYNRIITNPTKKLSKCTFCKKDGAHVRMTNSMVDEKELQAFVECGKCGARGPIVFVSRKEPMTDAIITKSVRRAIDLWNK